MAVSGEHSLRYLVESDDNYDQLVARLEDSNEKDANGNTLLHIACSSFRNNPRIEQLLIDRCVDVNSPNKDGHTALHLAVMSRKPDTVLALIEAGASLNARDSKGRTALHYSIRKTKGNTAFDFHSATCILESLLHHPEIDINVEDTAGETPLMLAEKEGDSKAMEALKRKKPNITFLTKKTMNPSKVVI